MPPKKKTEEHVPIPSTWVISRRHHDKPKVVGPYRIALLLDGSGFDVLDPEAEVVFSSISGAECEGWAREQVAAGVRYKD